MTYLAVPISGKDLKEVNEQIKSAKSGGAEMLELRTDMLSELETGVVKKAVKTAKGTSLPVIVTCRDKAQGGIGQWGPDKRVEILIEAVKAGADYIDCEYDNFVIGDVRERIVKELLEHSGTRLILSAHNFEGRFSDIEGLYEEIHEAYPECIVKLVYTAGQTCDCFEAFDLLKKRKVDLIVFCMGEDGVISRILTKKFGGYLTFASLKAAEATAPGQIEVEQMKNLYRWDRIDAKTELFGVIGDPVGHSLSPAIFNACFDKDGSNSLYLPVLIKGGQEEFTEFMENLTVSSDGGYGFGGFSVTIPHKAHALKYVSKAGEFIEPLAADIGAVNTLKIGIGGRVSGYNTDYAGAMDALCTVLGAGKHELHKVDVAVVGAGGVSRAIVAGLAEVGAKVTVYNRTVSKAEALAEEFGCKYAGLEGIKGMNAKVLVNCTSIGMYPEVEASPVPEECLCSEMAVFDTVYNPLETMLLKQAAEAGAQTVNGAEMFVRQAMAQYKLFTGTDANEEIMRKTVFDCLS